MNIVKGDLLKMAENLEFDAIVHGCNCFHAMGSGIAGQIARRYPQVPRKDVTDTDVGDTGKLGDYTFVTVTKKVLPLPKFAGVKSPAKPEIVSCSPFSVINGYTQYEPGADFIPSIFRVLLQRLNHDYAGQHLAFPKIGCGIGGGDWEEVEDMLLTLLPDVKVTVVVYG